jgi:Rad3-related DNA helicase
VEAGNLLVHFPSLKRLKAFLDYLEAIDPVSYKTINNSRGLSHDIYLPVGDTSVNMAFSIGEFEELKQTVRRFLEKENALPPPATALNTVFINILN